MRAPFICSNIVILLLWLVVVGPPVEVEDVGAGASNLLTALVVVPDSLGETHFSVKKWYDLYTYVILLYHLSTNKIK